MIAWRSPQLFSSNALGIGLGLLTVLLHLADNLWVVYGLFRDEYYYLACADRLASGYVDQPPFSIYVLYAVTGLFGESTFAVRLVPALAHGFTVWLCCKLCITMGGGRLAVLLAGAAMCISPIFIAMGAYYSMNSIDILLWTLVAYLTVRVVQDPQPIAWMVLGLVLGIGLLNKLSFLWLGLGTLIGLLLTPQRKLLLSVWPYVAGVVALVVFLPFIFWNITHDMAHVEFMQNAISYKYNTIGRVDFLKEQLLLVLPTGVLLAIAGLYFYFFTAYGKPYRLLGWIFITVFVILLLNGHSKGEYLAASFSILFAGGGVAVGRLPGRWWRNACVAALVALHLAVGGAVLPLATSILPTSKFIVYSRWLNVQPANTEGKEQSELPQFFADRFGWKELAGSVSAVYSALQPHERRRALVKVNNYGEAAALEYYAGHMPRVACGHNSYFYWLPDVHEQAVVIAVGHSLAELEEAFAEVKEVRRHRAELSMPYEADLPIYVCRLPKVDVRRWLRAQKHFE